MATHEIYSKGFEKWIVGKACNYPSTRIEHVSPQHFFYATSLDHSDMQFGYKKKGQRVDFRRIYCMPETTNPNTFSPSDSLTLETEEGEPSMIAYGFTGEDGKSQKSLRVYRGGRTYYSETNALRALMPGWKGNHEYRDLEVTYESSGLFESMRFSLNFPYLDRASSVGFSYQRGSLQRSENDDFPSESFGLVSCALVSDEKILFQRSSHEMVLFDEIPIPLSIPKYSMDSLVSEELLANPTVGDVGADSQWRHTNPSGLVGIRWDVKDRYNRQFM